jgi:hypothetical protein
MTRKTRKHSEKGIHSIPELRRAFEHVEDAIDDMIRKRESKQDMISQIRKEWLKVFHKTLDKASADALVTHHMNARPKHMKGGAQAIAGAPLDYALRPGVYLDQGKVPGVDGGLTKTVGGGYGSYVQYVDHGFVNPEIAQLSDPVKGQSVFPLAPRVDMGSNAFSAKGGKRGRQTRRKIKGGSAMLEQAFMRPISPGAGPTSPLFDIQQAIRGAGPGMSPDSTQRTTSYQLGNVYPKAVNIST